MPGHRPATAHDLDCHVANERAKAVDPGNDKMVKCPCCGGSTVVQVDYRDKTRIESCGICHGSGEVAPAQAEEWGRANE